MGKATDDGSESELLKAGVELVKAVPIYEDAIQPLAKELGKAGGAIGEAVNAAFLPLRGAIWGFNNIASFLENRVSKNLTTRNVPRERIQFPDPDVAVPAIEAMRYSKLRSQYAELLTTAIDSETARHAHPAFVEVLSNLPLMRPGFSRLCHEKDCMSHLSMFSTNFRRAVALPFSDI